LSAARLRAAIGFALVAACLAIYAQVGDHEFVDYDDYITIVHNDALSADSLAEALRVAVTPHHANWIPLTTLSLVLDRRLHGSSARGQLLGNVALHALASLLLFLALEQLTRSTWRSAFVAAVFAVHPLHVESVAWASERKDVLCGVFFMLTLYAYAGYARRPASPLRYAAVCACACLALLAKPMAVSLPAVLLLLDYWPLRRLSRRAALEKLPILAAAIAVSLAAIATQQSADSIAVGARLPLDVRSANAIDALGAYLRQSVWPSGLAAFHPYTGGEPSGTRVAVFLGLIVVAAAAFALRRSQPWLIVGWLWFLGMLAPVIGLVQAGPQGRADRYLYLPQIGLAIAVSWGACELARGPRARRALAAVGIAALAGLAVAAWVQVGSWRDSFALFERVLAIHPDAQLGHERLATLHLRAGRIDRARSHFERAFEIDPAQGRRNLLLFELATAAASQRRGDVGRQVAHLRAALALDPAQASARNDLAWLLATAADAGLRSPAEAVQLAEAGAGSGASANQLDTLAAAYAAAGRFDDAVRAARQALARAQGGPGAQAQAGDARLAREIESRLRSFERGEPWTEPAPATRPTPRAPADAAAPADRAASSPRARPRVAPRRGSRARAPRPPPTRASAAAASDPGVRRAGARARAARAHGAAPRRRAAGARSRARPAARTGTRCPAAGARCPWPACAAAPRRAGSPTRRSGGGGPAASPAPRRRRPASVSRRPRRASTRCRR
jgi:tetratricopeptide (TPR) repeat protein